MIIRKCDFCGAEGAEEVRLPQPNEIVVSNSRKELARYRSSGIYYKNFDLCKDCQDNLFKFIQLLKERKNV